MMATTYSKIQRNFWETDEARDMTPEEKYFWMYLQTNSNMNTLGCYTFRMRKAMDETGYNKETIEKLLEKMVQQLRILYDKETGEVFLLNSSEIYWNQKTATMRAITADLKEIQSKTLLEAAKTLLWKNGIFAEKEAEESVKTVFSEDEKEEKEQTGTTGNKREQMGTNGNKRGEEEEEEKEKDKKKSSAKRSFTPPTLEDVTEYCRERGNHIDPQHFIDYNEARGWMMGKNKMKDWKAAVRTWERQDAKRTQGQTDARRQGAAAENPFAERLARMNGGEQHERHAAETYL